MRLDVIKKELLSAERMFMDKLEVGVPKGTLSNLLNIKFLCPPPPKNAPKSKPKKKVYIAILVIKFLASILRELKSKQKKNWRGFWKVLIIKVSQNTILFGLMPPAPFLKNINW